MSIAHEEKVNQLVFGPQVRPGRPKLTDSLQLSALLNRFAGSVIILKGDYLAGKYPGVSGRETLEGLVKGVSGTLLGENADYQPSEWFAPDGLGAALVQRYQLECRPEQAPQVLLAGYVGFLLETVAAGAAGQLPTYLVRYRLDRGVEIMRDIFLGMDLPAIAAEEEAQAKTQQERVETAMVLDALEERLDQAKMPSSPPLLFQ